MVTAVADGHHNKENRLDDLVSYLADRLKNVRNFNPGDYRLAELDRQVTDYMHDSIADVQVKSFFMRDLYGRVTKADWFS